jgi:hypothetical protein
VCILNYLAAAAGVVTAQGANTGLTVLLLQVIVLRLDSPGNGKSAQHQSKTTTTTTKRKTLLIIEIDIAKHVQFQL